jgi:hypothetical protein
MNTVKVLNKPVLLVFFLLLHFSLSAIIWEIKQDGTGDFFAISRQLIAGQQDGRSGSLYI